MPSGKNAFFGNLYERYSCELYWILLLGTILDFINGIKEPDF